MTVSKGPSDVSPHSGVLDPRARTDLWLLVFMLALALVGIGVTEIEHSGGKYYWMFLVLVYAGIGIAMAWQRAKTRSQPIWPMIRKQVLHWLGALVAINIVLVFETGDIASRGAAADYSVLVLALSCYLAGVHFNWSYMLLGGVLAVIALGLGYLDQISLFFLVLPLAALAIWLFARKRLVKTAADDGET